MKLKVGIIGCGMITKVRHAPEYAENPNCEIAAFYDHDRKRSEALASQYGAVCCESADGCDGSGLAERHIGVKCDARGIYDPGAERGQTCAV